MKQSYYEREPKATQQDLFVHHVFTKNYFFWLLHEKCVQEKAKFSSSNYNYKIRMRNKRCKHSLRGWNGVTRVWSNKPTIALSEAWSKNCSHTSMTGFKNKLEEIAAISTLFTRAEENIFKMDTWNSPFLCIINVDFIVNKK